MRLLIIALILLSIGTSNAQNANPDSKRTRHWVFGEKNWIEWTDTGALQHPGSKAIQTEQMAVYTDTAGKLQLYFDSKNIYDSEHNVITNGAIPDGFWSAHRGAVFVPYPGSDSLCYLFYTTYSVGRNFAYALVNWKSKRVLKAEVLIKNYVIEGISSTLHHNNYFYWICGALQKSDYLFFYLITDKGILPCPFLQPNLSSYKSSSGQCGLSFSLSNKNIVNYDSDINRMQIADFNSFNTKLSNAYTKYTPGFGYLIGAEFSENDSFLYTQVGAYEALRQFRLSNWSNILIDDNSKFPIKYGFGLCRLNNTNIVSGYYGGDEITDTNCLMLITNTNRTYQSGDYNPDWLKATNRIKYAPPYFPYNFYRKYRSEFSYLTNCSNGLLELKAITTGTELTVNWRIISPKNKIISITGNNYTIKVADSGVWKVRMIANYSSGSDTIIKNIPIFTPFPNRILGPDIPVCKDTFSISLKIPQYAICPKWENLISTPTRNIDTFGVYSVQFYDSNYCQYNDTITIFKADTLPKPLLIFTSKDSLIVSNYKPSEAWKFVFSNAITRDTINWPNFKVNDTGLWKVEVISNTGCNNFIDSLPIQRLKDLIKDLNEFIIYPNPVDDKIYIKPDVYYYFSITDIHGKVIKKDKGTEIDVSSLKSGVYILQTHNKNQNNQLFKFIKL